MILSWGKCIVSKAASVSGAPSGSWTEMPTPREGTTQITTSAGTDLEAKIEGGETIDRMPGKNTYALEWEEFVEKGRVPSFIDNDGVVPGEWALKVIPAEDEQCPGIQIDKSSIKSEIVYSSTDGMRIKYTATALKPATGNSVKLLNVALAEVTSITVKDSNDSSARTIGTSAESIDAGSIEVVFNGTNMNSTTTASLIVGGNVINLTKDVSSTNTAAKFTGSSSAGALTKIVLDGATVAELPAA